MLCLARDADCKPVPALYAHKHGVGKFPLILSKKGLYDCCD
nr:MAG TPA: hypothetical protein [Caudoviricetes sp.]